MKKDNQSLNKTTTEQDEPEIIFRTVCNDNAINIVKRLIKDFNKS